MILAIDTGGTKTLVSVFDKNGTLGETVKFPTPADTREYVRTLREVVTTRFAQYKIEVVVVALPGIIKDDTAIWCENLGWSRFQAVKELSDLVPGAPVIVENDANLAGLAEALSLTPVPTSVFYVTISTGIGSGIITGGSIDPGLRLSEAGHMLVEYDGRVRPWEDFASGHAIVKVYKQFAHDITSKRTWRQIADRISRGFLAAIPLVQPEVIIIGGSIGTYFHRYDSYLKEMIKEQLPAHIACPKIIKAQHPEQAVLYGCYYYGKDFLARHTPRR